MLKRTMRNGWHNVLRNKTLSIVTILIIALMFFVFNIVLALRFATDSVITAVGQKIDISVEVQQGVDTYLAQTVVDELKALPEIKDVILVTREQALDNFGSKYPNVIQFLDQHQLDNPLPDVIRIVSQDVSHNNDIIRFLERPKYERILNQSKLKLDTDQKGRNEKIISITKFIKTAGLWLNLIVAFVALLIIFNSISLNIHAHRKEIAIMRLVGARHPFIRGGFIFEGLFYALIAFLISLLFARFTLVYISTNLLNVISNENLLVGLNAILIHFEDNFFITLSWQLLAALTFGLLSSYLAIEMYLRKKRLF